MVEFTSRPLAGKKGVILGIANEDSIAYGCAQAFRGFGADVAITYTNDKAKPFVEPLAKALDAPIILPCDVRVTGQLENVFQAAEQTWGKLDFALHSIASAPKQDLHSPLSQCSRDGFLQAMEVSCYSFIPTAHLAAPMMRDGGTILTMTYYGAEKVIEHYNVMGPVKAALESAVRYLAYELGPSGIRVHAISPGSVRTRAASGIEDFDELLDHVARLAPTRRLVSIDDEGATTAFLATKLSTSMVGIILSVSEAAPHRSSAANNDARKRSRQLQKRRFRSLPSQRYLARRWKQPPRVAVEQASLTEPPAAVGGDSAFAAAMLLTLEKLRNRISPGMKRSLHQSPRSRSAFISKPVGTTIQSDGGLSWIIDRRTCYGPLASDLVVTSML